MSEKKKLMLISPMLHQGGFERVCIATARLLAPYFDVVIVIFSSANIAYDVEGLNIVDLNLGARKGKVRKTVNLLRRSFKVRQLKKRIRPDISYSFGPTANLVNALSRTGKTKVWLGLRNYTDVEETVNIKIFTCLADLMICCSKVIEKELNIRFRYQKTATLYNLYDVEDIQKKAWEKEADLPWADTDREGRGIINLVSMGRDDDMKGFWHMLKVFALIHEKIPETRLVLLGAGSFDYYRKLAKDLKVSEAVYFAGMRKDPYRYLRKGRIYLLTSLNEGFPNALVEGMALGLVPVSADCMTGPAEILLGDQEEHNFGVSTKNAIYGKYGILVPAMSRERDLNPENILPEERNMADIVIDLLEDEEKLKHYQQAARERAQFFTYDSYVSQFLRLSCGMGVNVVK